MYIEGDVPYVGTNNNNGGWNDWSWIIGLAVVGGIFGNGGFGFGGNNRGNCATTADLSAGFANSEIMSDLNDILLGQASMQNFINQGFAGLNNTITTGFAGVNNAVCTLGYNQAALVNGLSRELADCCCTTQRNIDSLRFDISKGFCDVIRAGQDNTRSILEYLTSEKIAGLQAENAGLKAQISNDRQSAYLLSELKECPKAAYIVPNPNCCYNYNVTGFGYGNGCGASVL
jgi:hypothetical protein